MSLDIVSSVACGAVRSLFGPQTSPSKYDEAASHLRRTDTGGMMSHLPHTNAK